MVSLLKLKPWQAFLFAGAATYISVLFRILTILHLPIPFQDEIALGVDVWDGLGGLVTIVWLYTLGTQLNLKLPLENRESLTFFNVCFVGIIIVLIAMVWQELDEAPDRRMQMLVLLFAFVFHIYIYWLTSRLLFEAEDNPRSGVRGIFIALVFLPIGIWFLQERINKVFADRFEEIDPNTPLDHQLDRQPQG